MDNINPNKINQEKNKIIRDFILQRIKRKSLTMDHMFSFYTKAFDQKDYEKALLWIYYINNTMKKNEGRHGLTKKYRDETITAMLNDLCKVHNFNIDNY